jgi:hypothetical protein
LYAGINVTPAIVAEGSVARILRFIRGEPQKFLKNKTQEPSPMENSCTAAPPFLPARRNAPTVIELFRKRGKNERRSVFLGWCLSCGLEGQTVDLLGKSLFFDRIIPEEYIAKRNMTIVIDDILIPEGRYDNEKELEDVLCKNPALLQLDCDAELHLLSKQVSFGDTKADILFLDKNKNVVIVEVKLADNPQVRRKVVGQILDYASRFVDLSSHELNELTKEKLQKIIKDKFCDNEGVETIIESRLRRGIIKLIVAVDKENERLRKIIRFLCQHSDLDIALVEISKYLHDDKVVYVSKVIEKSHKPLFYMYLFALLVKCCERDKALRITPRDRNKVDFRQIHIEEWRNKNIHYEFLARNGNIGVEFHIESRKWRANEALFNAVRKFDGESINDHACEFHRDLHELDRHALRITIPFIEENIEVIADTMKQFIELTRPAIGEELSRNKQSK